MEYEEAQTYLNKKRDSMLATDQTISKLLVERDQISKNIADNDIELKKLEHKILRFHQEKNNSIKFLEHLQEKYSWIENEKQFYIFNNFYF